MGWIAKIFGAASKDELRGLRMDHSSWNWAIGETKDFSRVLSALPCISGETAVIFIEGSNAKGELKQFIKFNSITAKEQIARGTVWPKQNVVHLPASLEFINQFATLSQDVPPMEIATHFHVYEKGQIILEWYDAFTAEMFVSKSISEDRVKNFANAIGVYYKNEGEPDA